MFFNMMLGRFFGMLIGMQIVTVAPFSWLPAA
jgi:hypothetical protein